MAWFMVFLLAATASFLLYLLKPKRDEKCPPGPSPLPLIGNLVYIGRQDPVNFIGLYKISRKYGDIVTLWTGGNKNVLVSKSDIAKEILSRPDCLNRPINGGIWDRMLRQNIGMAFSSDEGWSNIRKFTSRAMRDYGFGNQVAMEKLVKEELLQLVQYIKEEVNKTEDGVLQFNNFFQPSLLNVMLSMLTGRRQNYSDEELVQLVQGSKEWFEAPLLGILTVMAFPWTRFVCPGLLGYTQQMNALKKMGNCCRAILEKHRRKGTYLKDPACFTDSFLKAAYENRNDPSNQFTDDQFAVLCTDLIQGGTDTTSNWMSFAVVLLILHPDIQEKIVQEIRDVIGMKTSPDLGHKNRMTYTQAAMLEIHRWARLTVIMPPRKATEDFYCRNYLITKDTAILVNLHACYMNPDIWGDPENFRPERFLSSDGGTLVNTENMDIIFGGGRRVCFGESLAKDSSFLYLTTLLQNFKFQCPPAAQYPLPEAEPQPALILTPKPFYVKISPRV